MNLSFLLSNPVLVAISAGFLSILYGLFLTARVLKKPRGDEKMNAIADAIAEGAAAYLKRQYLVVSIIGVIILAILYYVFDIYTAAGFAVGAVFSALAGVIGMNVAVRSNIRTAQAAKSGLAQAFGIAFSGGAVTGLMVAGLALLAISGSFYMLQSQNLPIEQALRALVALGFGGSLISVFARLGGGIYTKGADVGTDMVGKIEKGIPEDDPRNPGVIADLVGDNVGDDAGMAADLFETFVITLGMVIITEYFTSKKFPSVKNIARASSTGSGTNVIAGLAVSMKATLPPILLIAAGIWLSYDLAGLYGLAISAMSMLSLTGIIVAIDAFGPITDNAGGIVEMTNQPENVRKITDPLDAVGNTTKAVTKAYAIGSAGLAALVLFASFTQELGL